MNCKRYLSKLGFAFGVALLVPSLIACFPDDRRAFNVYISVHNNEAEISSLSQQFLHGFSKKAHPDFNVAIEQARGKEVVSLFSQYPTRQAIRATSLLLDGDPKTSALEPVPSDDKTLILSMQRVIDQARRAKEKKVPLKAFIITRGTQEVETLKQLNYLSEKITKNNLNVHLYLIGISPKHRLSLSRAFAPLKSSIAIAGNNYYEWNRFLHYVF